MNCPLQINLINFLLKSNQSTKKKSFNFFLTKTYNNRFNFQNINEENVTQIIDKLAPITSFGFDSLSTKLLKTIKHALMRHITIIINQMLNTGIFPDKLKLAKIMPVYKRVPIHKLHTNITFANNFQNVWKGNV